MSTARHRPSIKRAPLKQNSKKMEGREGGGGEKREREREREERERGERERERERESKNS